MQPFMNTSRNKRVNPLDIQLEDINIEDIAHALALCNRFAGHTKLPISVAQHSVWVSKLVEMKAGTWGDEDRRALALQGLLHDGSEAYLGDVTKWLKATPEMAAYREAEDKAQTTIFRKFGCDVEQHPIVSWADKIMVCWEADQGIWGFFNHEMPPGYAPVSMTEKNELELWKWEFIEWREAERQFLARFLSLTFK